MGDGLRWGEGGVDIFRAGPTGEFGTVLGDLLIGAGQRRQEVVVDVISERLRHILQVIPRYIGCCTDPCAVGVDDVAPVYTDARRIDIRSGHQ